MLVGVILSYLYSIGFLEVGDPRSLAYAILIILGIFTLGGLLTRFFAGKVVDGFLGFGTSLRAHDPDAEVKRMAPRPVAGQAENIPLLERLVKELPSDAESSRRLAEAYLKAGDLEKFISERTRILEKGKLSREETCTILHRLADVDIEMNERIRAADRMRAILARFPNSPECQLAEKRLEIITTASAMDPSRAI